MKVKIVSKKDETIHDLTILGHFKGFVDEIVRLTESDKEFKIYNVVDHELYNQNLNHH